MKPDFKRKNKRKKNFNTKYCIAQIPHSEISFSKLIISNLVLLS